MSSSIGLVLDLMIAGLLGTTIVFAAILNRRLSVWRKEKAEFERLIAAFNSAAARAEAGIERLKVGSEETGRTLQQATTKGQSLRDDLAYLLERAEPLADRLTDIIRAGRGLRPQAETQLSPPVEASLDLKTDGAAPRETDEAAERARTKRELLRALAALR